VRPRFSPLKVLLVFLALSGNAVGGADAAPRVVASIAPLHSLVAAVMQGAGAPALLLSGGESPHSFSLRPSDARMLNTADVLFWIGPQLELPLARILPNLAVTESVSMLEVPGLRLLRIRHLDHRDPAARSPGSGLVRADDDGGIDPHVWLSTTNAVIMTDEIASVLARIDPARTALYRSNAARLKARLTTLNQELRRQLAGIGGGYAVFHDAYRYLEQQFALQSAGVVTTHPERSPGAAHLHELRRELADKQVRCLFSEPQFQPRLVAMLSEGLPIRHAVLDPLGADIPPGPEAYPQLMRAMVQALVGCMQADAPQ